MMKNIKKSVIAGALALAMVGTAIPVTANASTITKSGSYSNVSLSKTSTGNTTVRATATGTNKSGAARYMAVYTRQGASYAVSAVSSSSVGVVNSGSSKSTTANNINRSCYANSVIYSGTSSNSSALESIHVPD